VLTKDRVEACAAALAVLSRHNLGVSAGALWALEHSHLSEGLARLPGTEAVHLEIGEFFPCEVTEICRQALSNPDSQKSFVRFPARDEILDFCVRSIGYWGGPADVSFLRGFSNDGKLGRFAIDAIKRLERAETQPLISH
jgi:hypothetical protein